MAAPEGNNYALKWKTPEERKAACDRYCAHLAEGYSSDCFPEADLKTIKSYMERYPEDFPTEKVQEALRQSKYFWEKVGNDGARGQIEGFNAASWVFNMKNRFKWRDKPEDEPIKVEIPKIVINTVD